MTAQAEALVLPGVSRRDRPTCGPARESGRRTVLQTAAVIGAEFGTDLLAGITRADVETCLDACEAAVDARLLIESGVDRWRFMHALIRGTLIEQESTSRRGLVHRKAAALLEADDPPDPVAIAYHWSRASGTESPPGPPHGLSAGDKAMSHLAA